MAKKIEIMSEREIKKLIVQNYWGPYSPDELIKMVKGGRIVLDELAVSESTEKASRDVDNWMGWLEKRIVINPMERDYIEFALRQIRK
jgi:hypothetical protein